MKVTNTQTEVIYTLELDTEEATFLHALAGGLSLTTANNFVKLHSPKLAAKQLDVTYDLYNKLTDIGFRLEDDRE